METVFDALKAMGKATSVELAARLDISREEALKREGHTVLNPAVLPDGLTQPHYMDICMAMIRCVDAIYMLNGWQRSAGAKAELALAEKLGHEVVFQEVSSEKN